MSFQILLALGSQILGFCLSGLLRQFVVWPSSMIWIATLVYLPSSTLRRDYGKRGGGHLTREGFFCIVTAASAGTWLPFQTWE